MGVFYQETEEQAVKMHPKPQPTPEQLYASFKEEVESWDHWQETLAEMGAEITGGEKFLIEMDEIAKSADKLAKDLKRIDVTFFTNHPDVATEKKRVKIERFTLQTKNYKTFKTKPIPADSFDVKNTDTEIHGFKSEFEIHDVKITHEKIMDFFDENPTSNS